MQHISDSTVRRLSLYLRFLEDFETKGSLTISSQELAERGGTTSAQVRKDLSFFGSFGKRGLGYSVPELAGKLRDILGLGRSYSVILVGAGKLGTALVQYRGFGERGFNFVAAYDNDPERIGQQWNGLTVRNVEQLSSDLAEKPADIAIVATPPQVAQEIAALLVDGGISAIMNFTNARLDAPPGVSVKDVNMALELEALSFAIRNWGR